MKNIYFKNKLQLLALFVLLIGSAVTADAQIKKAFTQRTSQYSPTKKIYNVKGDFTMLGNTCLTPQNYADGTNNNGQFMTYVDKDTDPTTLNSSSSTLVLSTENGAIPSCSNIVYAGLYWTGKSSANPTFNVTKTVPTNGVLAINNDLTIAHNQNIDNTNYSLSVGRNNPSATNRNPIYTFSGNGNTYVFNFFNASATNRVTLSVNGAAAVNVPVTVNAAGTEATLNTGYSITDGTVTLKVLKLIRSADATLGSGPTQDTSFANVNVSGTVNGNVVVTKAYDKRKISLKGPGDAAYTQFTAGTNDIYYPSGTDDDIYSAYTEVTDFVKNHGVGQYWAADMALLEGNVGGTGYSGGWGIIVVYENSKMKYRDVTLFDGYAYVESANSGGFTLPVTGFNTVQTGNVGMKLGVMASEGDVAFTGDYFQIQKLNTANYQSLTHPNIPGGPEVAGTATNFFNSSINSGGTRNPNLLNNTGIDVNMINIPNTGNTVIGNSQTSTNFKYGTNGDTYSIFAIAMAVDAYIPDIEGSIAALTVNGVSATNPVQSVLPGQNLVYKVEIRNRGTEAINNFKVTIPIPYNATYVPTATKNIYFTPASTPNTVTFEPTIGSNGSIVWNLGTLPLPANGNPDTLLGDLTFTLKATEDCTLLKNANCNNVVATNGIITGSGAITGIIITDKSFIQGYTNNGSCTGVAIAAPFLVNINAVDYVNTHCQGTPPISSFVFCSPGNNIPITSVSGSFPAGSLFYNQFPVTGASTQYTINNPFPATVGTSTYYAVPPNSVSGCYFQFTITVTTITTQPTASDISYCQNATAAPLTATASAPGMTLYYYTSVNGTAQMSITPSTATVGQTTYYVAEGQSTTCIGPKKPIVVTVYPSPTITAPASVTIQGCSTAAITGLPYSTTAATITLAQFLTAGGILNSGVIGAYTLSYIDIVSGTCPKVVTRTYTVATLCGNVTAQQNIIISDTVPPVISALPGLTVVSCESTPVFTTPTATDNCGGVVTLTFADVNTAKQCTGSYKITRTWTATDICGNIATASQVIDVTDTTPPVISQLPPTSTINCPATPVFALATATDACGSDFTLTSADVTTPGSCAGNYSITRTWTAIDGCGNTATSSQTINVIDNVPPVISALPAPLSMACSSTPQWTTPTATDTCSANVTLTQNTVTTPGACANSYTLTRTWTATDGCGNTATATQVFNVSDTIPPVITALPAASTVQCTATPQWATPTATDTCSGVVTLTQNTVTTPGACANAYTLTRTWTATDVCGNTATASQVINVIDTVPPTISALPAASTVQCTATLQWTTPTATDTCSGTVTLASADVTTPGTCANAYSVTRTWTATDACGNTATATQVINVIDTVPPTISALPAASTISCPATPQWTTPTATDTCSGTVTLTSVDSTTPGTCANANTITRTWTATDACGNTATATQVINVIDNTPPVISALPAASTIQCTATPQWITPTATDTCSGTVTLTSADVTTPGACANTYSITRTWTATDVCGNTATATQVINVIDTVPPTISALPAVATIQCSAAPQWATPTATDTCSGIVTLVSADVTTPGACANAYTITRTWTATDVCGNTATASQVINVIDTVPPTISALPAASTISCPAVPQWATPTATDTCSGTVTLVSADVTTPGTCANSYSITRTWTATDVCGNTATATQTITVQDNTPPVISQLPAASTISCPAAPQWATPTATDTCSGTVTLVSADVTTPGACAGSYAVTRTWTATDACGNTATATQTINVQDTTAPVIAPLPAASTISCPAQPEFAVATATDACGSLFTLVSDDVTTNGTCAGSYSVTRTWTATDACGNVSTATQTINVQDITAPVIAPLPVASTISCPAQPAFAVATAVDACGSTFTLVSADVTTPGSCAGNYSVTRTWTATDACGNSSTATQTINVQDITAPTITAEAQNITVQCDGTGNTGAVTAWLNNHAGATATDACSDVTWTNNFNALSSDCSAAVTVIFTATDGCGNASTTSATFTVQDTTAPVAPAAPATANVVCATDVPANISLTATDNCAGQITVQGVDAVTPGSCANSFVIVRTWTFTDACGNSSNVSQTINVNDTVAPVAPAAPANVTASCAGDVPAMISLTATDNCNGEITVAGVDTTVQGSCPNSFVTTRTWTFTDVCGNTSSVSQTITINDTIAPVAPAAPANVTASCAGDVPAMISLTAIDNCNGEITVAGVDTTVPGSCPNSFVTTRTWTFVDACGNTSSVSQTITINDTIAPVAPAAPANVTASCAGDVPAMVSLTAIDNCNGEITVAGVNTTVQGSCPNSFVTTRTWTFVDACGNTSSVSQTFTINDTIAPVIADLPATATINCPATPAFAVATATDNCAGDVTLTSVDATTNGECAGSYAITRTWTATDACGNTATATQTINVQDNTAPVISPLPETATINCPATPVFADANAVDACGSAFTLTSADVTTPGSCAGNYSVTRTWTATDACGNTSNSTQTINVQDITAPTITAEAQNITVQCDGTGNTGAVTAWLNIHGGATATDACSDVTWTNNFDALSTDCSAAVTVIFTATDGCGNASTSSATFTVQDTTAPVAPVAPAAVNVVCASDVPANISLTAIDNCAGAITVQGVDATVQGACPNSFVTTRTWTFTDACGNTSNVSQTINVNDTIAPVAPAAPANLTVSCASEVPAMISLTASDNCGDQITAVGTDVISIAIGACVNNYVVTRTWSFTDACGNSSSATQTITVNDTTAPVAPAAPAAVTASCAGDVPAMVSLTATDNCGEQITAAGVDTTVAGSCANSFVTTRTWTFTDVCGNSSSVSQVITINDTTAPVAPAAPAALTISCAGEVPAMISLTASDNCGDQITAQGVDTTVAGSCPNSFVTTRTWTFTDACGNTSSASQVITVNDTTAPVAPAAPADVTGTCTVDVPAMISLTATDNCGDQITALGVDTTVAGACANSFVTTRTWTFVDACGNSSTATQTISVTDTVAPTFVETTPADISVSCDAIPAPATLTAVDNCDNASVPVTMTVTTVPGSCPNASEITRTWSATDACGNTATTSQVITVMDVTPPTFDAAIPASISVSCDAVPTAATITASDNCGTATVSYTETRADGLCLSTYVLTRTWIATDLCGNQAAPAVQVINVSDTTGPSIDGTLDNVVVGTCDNIPAAPQLTFIDNCSSVGTPTFTEVTNNPTNSTTYEIIRTWTVADACGNQSVFTQTVNVTPNPNFTVTVQGYAKCNTASDPSIVNLTALLPTGTPAGGTWTDLSNTGGLQGAIFDPLNISTGFYQLQYVVADGDCSRIVNVNMEVDDDCGIVLACDNVIIHNAFSPNNDGLNEFFSLENIQQDCHINNKVEIYNRWGVLVYEATRYDNAAKSFKGISEGRTTVDKSSELPTGTYFYIIQYTDESGGTVKKDGYLYLSR